MDIYHHTLMDHYRNPRRRGTLADPQFSCTVTNPTCGDTVSVQGFVNKEGQVHALFTGSGCVISQAAASLLLEDCSAKTPQEIQQLTTDYMLRLVAMPLGPIRVRCALLALEALQQGLADYQKGR